MATQPSATRNSHTARISVSLLVHIRDQLKPWATVPPRGEERAFLLVTYHGTHVRLTICQKEEEAPQHGITVIRSRDADCDTILDGYAKFDFAAFDQWVSRIDSCLELEYVFFFLPRDAKDPWQLVAVQDHTIDAIYSEYHAVVTCASLKHAFCSLAAPIAGPRTTVPP